MGGRGNMSWMLKLGEWLFKLIRPIVYYPVEFVLIGQGETEKGYVFHVTATSLSMSLVEIPKASVSLLILKDRSLTKSVEDDQLLYGEKTLIFESASTLEAYKRELSYGNVTDNLVIDRQPKELFLLLQVEGPVSSNPSSRLQIAKVYTGVRLRIYRHLWSACYAEFKLPTVTFIAGNKNTKIK